MNAFWEDERREVRDALGMDAPMDDERLAEIRDRVTGGMGGDWEAQDLLAEVDRLRAALADITTRAERAESALSRVEARAALTAMVSEGYTVDEVAAIAAANRPDASGAAREG